MQTHNFFFLQDKFPQLAELCENIEEIFYQDPQTVLIKGRIFSEELLKEITNQHDDLLNIDNLRLVERIQYLEKEEIITNQIARSFDTIRYLGNKASHKYLEYGLDQAFKMHKRLFEIAVWFMEVYGDYSFVAPKYKYPQPKSNPDIVNKLEEKLTSSLEEKFELLLQATRATAATVEVPEKKLEAPIEDGEYPKDEKLQTANYELDFNLKEGESYLLQELSKLKESSQEAIENSNQFSLFKEYLHVKRSIQDDLENSLLSSVAQENSKLIFLCGSVGDGKSHLLAYMKNKHPELVNKFVIHNDATESFDPHKSSLDTLAEVLQPFSDENIENSQEKLILAINLGVLHNFIESTYCKEKFKILANFIEKCKVFEDSIITQNRNDHNFQLISFSDYQSFELTDSGPESHYYSTLLEKIISPSDTNPFYEAYRKDKENKIRGFFIENYELLMLPQVRKHVVNLLIQVIIKHKTIISTRALLNFIHDILIPADENVEYFNADVIQKTERLLPNLIFEGKEKSLLLAAISQLDPIHVRSSLFDQMLIELNNSINIRHTFEQYVDLESLQEWDSEIKELGAFRELSNASCQLFNKTLIRFSLFLSKSEEEIFNNENYNDYLIYLYHFNVGNRSGLKKLYKLLKDSIFLWNGKPKDNYIYIDKSNQDIQVAQYLNIYPSFSHLPSNNEDTLNRFHLTIVLAYSDENKKNPVSIDIDYPLYEMMVNISKGYRPNKKDKEDCIQFVEFIDKIMKHGNKETELMFINLQSNTLFKLTYDEDYEEFTFRRE